MPRVTAPVSKLSRAISTAPATRTNPLLDSTTHNAGAALMPKYAELLRNRSSEHADSSRGLTTTHRPTPQPSLANRSKPLMQTFSSSASSAAAVTHLDAAVLPSMSEPVVAEATPRVPILPGNFTAARYADLSSAPVPEVTFPAIQPPTTSTTTTTTTTTTFNIPLIANMSASENKRIQYSQQLAEYTLRQFSDARKTLDKSKITVEKMPMASRKLASFAQRSQTNIHQHTTTPMKA